MVQVGRRSLEPDRAVQTVDQGQQLAHIRVAQLSIDGKATLTKARRHGDRARSTSRSPARVDARPAAKELDAVLAGVSAHITIDKPHAERRALDVSVASVKLGRRPTSDRASRSMTSPRACSRSDAIDAHIALENGRPHGEQLASIVGLRVHSARVAELLGRDVLSEDVALDATVSGTADQLVLAGTVHAGAASLRLDGNLDRAGRPR